MGIKTIKVGH